MLVAGPRNPLRALVKHLDISDADITELNIPPACRWRSSLDALFRPADDIPLEQRYPWMPTVKAKADAVARQATGG